MFPIITIILFILLTQELSAISDHTDCVHSSGTLTCKHQLPNKVLQNVSKIVIQDYLNNTIDDSNFRGTNWDLVSSLHITVNTKTYLQLKDDNFFHLRTRLSHLGIHAPKLKKIDRYSFNGLTNLHILDLSNSVYINGTQLKTALLESKLELKEFYLGYISSSEPFQIDQKFMQIVSTVKLERLSLSGSNIMIKGPLDCEKITFQLVNIDMSNISLYVYDLDLRDEVKAMTLFMKHVEILDFSYIVSRLLELDYNFLQNRVFVYNCKSYKFLEILYKMHHVYLNGIFKSNIIGNNSLVDMSACNVRLKSLHMKDNNFVYLNVTIRWPEDNKFETIDLSYNHMKYLNKHFFTGLRNLRFLDLSVNHLYVMETSGDFSSLLSTFPELRHFNVSHNKLTSIPKQMFANNKEMLTLDLSNNHLTSITFDVHQFKCIREINLRNNRIAYLHKTEFMQLDNLLHLGISSNIDITRNPLQCMCKTVDFLEWVSSKLQPQTNRVYKCNQDGKYMPIDNKTIDKAKYSCEIPAIIVGWTCGSVTFVLVIVVAAAVRFKKYRKTNQMRTRRRFINYFSEGRLSQRYLCFISYSSNEENNLVTDVNKSIDKNLKLLTGIKDRFVICTGDGNFRPGYSVVNEAYRLVQESFLVVCLVSKSFCASSWCELEMRIATERNKPIVLIFIEEVDRLEMPTIMQNIFDTHTRAKLILENETYILVPDYGILSESILGLAIEQCVKSKWTPEFELDDPEQIESKRM